MANEGILGTRELMIKSGSDEATTSESLSEDNYSRLDEDEQIEITPDDVDLNLIEDEANQV